MVDKPCPLNDPYSYRRESVIMSRTERRYKCPFTHTDEHWHYTTQPKGRHRPNKDQPNPYDPAPVITQLTKELSA